MWYCIWFIGMGVTLACITRYILNLEAKSAFEEM